MRHGFVLGQRLDGCREAPVHCGRTRLGGLLYGFDKWTMWGENNPSFLLNDRKASNRGCWVCAVLYNERCCSQRRCGTLCNCAVLRTAPFTANLWEPLQQNAALYGQAENRCECKAMLAIANVFTSRRGTARNTKLDAGGPPYTRAPWRKDLDAPRYRTRWAAREPADIGKSSKRTQVHNMRELD